MSAVCRGLVIAVVALGAGCSKSSATAETDQPTPGSAARRLDDPLGAAAVCDEACASLGICHERVLGADSLRDEDRCMSYCINMRSPERASWAAYVVDAHRTNRCRTVIDETYIAEVTVPPPTIPPGELSFGCVGWSQRMSAAACVVGERGGHGTNMQLAFVGSGRAPLTLHKSDLPSDIEAIDETLAHEATALLARDGYIELRTEVMPLTEQRQEHVEGISFSFSSKQTKAASNMIAPTYSNRVVARCGGRTLELFRDDGEGVTATATVRSIGSHVLVEITVDTSREDRYGIAMVVVVVDSKSCKIR